MISYEIRGFMDRLDVDLENREIRRRFHENYEWLESYWQRKFNANNGVQLFCNQYAEFYWRNDAIKNIAKRLSEIRPVGSSTYNFEPTSNILRASYFLKYSCNLFQEGENEEVEEEIEHSKNWNQSCFHALFAIIKQIRDNLFHGRKTDLEEPQYERNKELVQIGAETTDILLLNLIEAEANF